MITVTLNVNGNGTVEGNKQYNEGDVVTCTASPTPEGQFKYWSIGNELFSSKNPLTFIATNDITLTAEFGPLEQSKARATITTNEMPYTIASNILLSNGQTLEEYLKL